MRANEERNGALVVLRILSLMPDKGVRPGKVISRAAVFGQNDPCKPGGEPAHLAFRGDDFGPARGVRSRT